MLTFTSFAPPKGCRLAGRAAVRLMAMALFVVGACAATHEPIEPTGCCDPATYPEGGIEGYHCCADGTWGSDPGGGYTPRVCARFGGRGEVCADPCDTAVVGEACGEEGLACGECTTPCDGCRLLSCYSGVWVETHGDPVDCFDCGGERCVNYEQYCEASQALRGARMMPTYQCVELPRECRTERHCACLAWELASSGIDNCTGDLSVGLTVSYLGEAE